MGSNQNVNFTSKGSGKRFILLFSGSESADHVDGYGKGSHTFEKRVAVLLCKYGSRHEKRYLTAFLNGFERTAHRYFGFSKPTSPQSNRSIGWGFSISDLS